MNEKNLLSFHKTLKRLRLDSNMTQKQAAEKIGISYQSYQAYEIGITLPTLSHFTKLCEIFETTPNELLGFSDI
ncbi:MAG: helix-turn-helix domain-containing protein [Clostridiales bacterium]|jgi:transcriptional regulator with XRE-family HTH domain|nr:helix-turn-helix domain-containing protein [Clostridiales bacterium]